MSLAPRVHQAFVGAGANLGDRWATLARATERLRAFPGIMWLERSSVSETEPVGGPPQPAFLNLVLGLETTLPPEDLLAALLEIEQQFGRVRTVRWGPRTLDLDLLLFEDETRSTPALELPHPRLFDRSFVTVPLRELLGRTRFQIPSWDALRCRLDPSRQGAGIRTFVPPLA